MFPLFNRPGRVDQAAETDFLFSPRAQPVLAPQALPPSAEGQGADVRFDLSEGSVICRPDQIESQRYLQASSKAQSPDGGHCGESK